MRGGAASPGSTPFLSSKPCRPGSAVATPSPRRPAVGCPGGVSPPQAKVHGPLRRRSKSPNAASRGLIPPRSEPSNSGTDPIQRSEPSNSGTDPIQTPFMSTTRISGRLWASARLVRRRRSYFPSSAFWKDSREGVAVPSTMVAPSLYNLSGK